MKPVFFSTGIPSNFYLAPIYMTFSFLRKEKICWSNEHYFQVSKLGLLDDPELIWEGVSICGHIDIARAMLDEKDPAQVKKMARSLAMDDEACKNWDRGIAVVRMMEANITKFSEHEHCRAWLANTNNRPLVEHRKDAIWGDNLDGTGKNLQGKILEIVRNTLCR